MIQTNVPLQQQKDGSWKPATPEPYYPSLLEKITHFFGKHIWVTGRKERLKELKDLGLPHITCKCLYPKCNKHLY